MVEISNSIVYGPGVTSEEKETSKQTSSSEECSHHHHHHLLLHQLLLARKLPTVPETRLILGAHAAGNPTTSIRHTQQPIRSSPHRPSCCL